MGSRATLFVVMMGLALPCAAADVARAETQHAAEGRRLYLQYCASCHGRDANGKGPVAPVLSPRPTDLTTLAQRFGSPLPKPLLTEFIDGRRDIRAHGPSDMPVWGQVLTDPLPGSPNAVVRVRGQLSLILDYLETLQRSKE